MRLVGRLGQALGEGGDEHPERLTQPVAGQQAGGADRQVGLEPRRGRRR